MAISYKELFDFDGLDAAFKELEQSEDHFSKAVIDDLKRIQKQSASTKSELQKLVDALKGVNVTNTTGRDRLGDLAARTEEATRRFTEQNNAIAANNRMLEANRAEIQRLNNEINALKAARQQSNSAEQQARTAYQQNRAETERLRGATQQVRLEINQLTLANRQARSAVVAAAGSYREAQQRLTALGNSIRNAEGGFSSTNATIRAQIAEYNRLNDALKRFDAQMGNHQRNVGNYKGDLQGVLGMLGNLAAGYLSAGAALSFAFQKNLSLDSLTASLTFTLGSAEATNKKLKELRETAGTLGLDFLTLANNYKSFAGAAIASNYSLKDTDRIFLSVSKAAAVLKLSNDQLGGALTAIQQMISKGNVQAEELRGQLGERLPGAFAIAARALGVTTQELDKMLKKGEVLASDLLPKLATELDNTFGDKITGQVTGMQAELNNLNNTLEQIATGGGLNKWFEDIIRGTNRVLIAMKNLTAGFVNAFKTIKSPSELRKSEENARKLEIQDKANSVAMAKMDQYQGIGVSKAQIIVANNPSELELNKRLIEQKNEMIRLEQRYNYFKALAKNPATQGSELDAAINKTKALNGQVLIQQSLVKELTKQYSELYPSKQKSTKELTDSELTSIDAIRKRITELSKMDGSAIEGSAIFNRIKALKLRLKELGDAARDAQKHIKDAIELLEDQKKSIERSLQLEAVKSNNFGELFRPSDTTLKRLAEVERVLQVAKNLGEYLKDWNGGNLQNLSSSALKANEALKVKDNEPVKFQGKTQKIVVGEKPGQARKAKEALDKEDPYKKIELEVIDLLENSFKRVTDIIGSQWSDMFSSMTDSLKDFVHNGTISFKDFGDIANGIASGIAGTFKAASEARIAALETEKDREVQAAGDNKAAKLAIEEDYNKRIAAQKRKAAIQEKEMALLSIAVNTAAAVMSVLSTGGGAHYLDFGVSAGILSAFVTGVGIAQAALVLAKPIPQFYTGTENAPEGIAEIAERGPEMIIHPDGKKEVATKRQYKYLKKGTKVKNAETTASLLSSSRLFVDREGNLTSLSTSSELSNNMAKMDNYHYVTMQGNQQPFDYDRLIKGLGKEIEKMPFDQYFWDEKGFGKFKVEQNTRIKDLNARNSWG